MGSSKDRKTGHDETNYATKNEKDLKKMDKQLYVSVHCVNTDVVSQDITYRWTKRGLRKDHGSQIINNLQKAQQIRGPAPDNTT